MQLEMVRRILESYEPEPERYEPFRVTFSLASPMYIGDNWYHSDALIARCLMEELLRDDFYNLPERQPLPVSEWLRLPVMLHPGGIYHASVLFPNTSLRRVARIYKRFDESDPLLQTKAKIRRGSGYYRDYMIQMPYAVATALTAYMHGDTKEVRRLLYRLNGLGKKTVIGGGQILSIELQPTETDCSLVYEGRAMREIPVEICARFDSRMVMRRAVIFPYWDLRNVRLVVVPGGEAELRSDAQ